MFSDKRKHKRKNVLKYCAVECPSGKWSCKGKVRDISQGGMGVEILKIPDIKDKITLYMLGEDGGELIKKGIVAWFKRIPSPRVGSMMGLQFIE